jgi:hypothetical protein
LIARQYNDYDDVVDDVGDDDSVYSAIIIAHSTRPI